MPASQAQDRLAWFTQAKFGLFIHWGPYALAGVEASWPIMAPDLAIAAFGPQPRIDQTEYLSLPARFNPVDYDPHEWLRQSSRAGIKYIVMTAKHHDGFCMFDAPGTDYKITRTPYGRDVCAELAEACAEAGIPLCFYYSQPDMNHPGYRDVSKPATANWWGEPRRHGWSEYLEYMEAHLRKLLSGYGPVAALWFDGLSGHDKYDPLRFHRLIRELSPATLVNDRLGGGFDFITPEQVIPPGGIPIRHSPQRSASDGPLKLLLKAMRVPVLGSALLRQVQKYGEGQLLLTRVPTAPYPSSAEYQPWETCLTLNRSWAYNPQDEAYKSRRQLIRTLVQAAGRGGNLLLNVGPTPQGTFPPPALERLGQIGHWMDVNNTAIYGTTYSPLQDLPFGVSTATQETIFLHVFDWPTDGKLTVLGLSRQISRAMLLASGKPLSFAQSNGSVTIQVPHRAPDPDVTVLALHT
jgi:alpha-L-fucosidase